MNSDTTLISQLFTNFWAVFLIFLFFGGSIFVHELGHFLAARRRGLKIDRFSIGFGPKLVSWTRDGVEYRISALPLGGYVALPQLADMGAIEGGSEEGGEELPPISYTDKVIVAVMGAVFNIIFAFFLACILWAFGQPSSEDAQSVIIGFVEPTVELDQNNEVPGPAFIAGIKEGDKILSIDGDKVSNFSELQHSIFTGSGRDSDENPQAVFTIERDGETQDIIVYPRLSKVNSVSGDLMRLVGIKPAHSLIIRYIQEGSPAHQAGLQENDRVISSDGKKLHCFAALVHHLKEKQDAPVMLSIERENRIFDVTLSAEMVARTKPLGKLQVKDGNRKASLLVQPFYEAESSGSPSDPGIPSSLKVHEIEDPTGFVFGNLEPGETIIRVNNKPIKSLQTFIDRINDGDLENLNLSIGNEFENQFRSLAVLGKVNAEILLPRETPMMGFGFKSRSITLHVDPITQVKGIVKTTLQVLGSLISPKSDISIRNLSGPPGIVRVIHMFSMVDIRLVIWFTCLLNINLAILNLLPIPVLDGGHIVFATLAKLRGKALPPNLVAGAQGIFMILLFSMMIYVSFFDVRRWQGDNEEEKRLELESSLYIQPEFSSAKDTTE